MSSDTPISAQAQVVLIDDDPHLRQALSQTLDLAGLEVVSLGDARGLAARLPALARSSSGRSATGTAYAGRRAPSPSATTVGAFQSTCIPRRAKRPSRRC